MLNATLPLGGIGSDKQDTTIYQLASHFIASLQATPSKNGLLVYGQPNGGPGCLGIAALDEFPGGQWVDTVGVLDIRGLIGICGDPDYTGNLTMGPLGNGTLIGSATEVPNPDIIELPGGSVNAVMSGKTLSGSFVVKFRYSTGLATYTVSFQALQVKP